MIKKKAKKHPKTKTKKHGWRSVFGNMTYASGPGDNIYVYG